MGDQKALLWLNGHDLSDMTQSDDWLVTSPPVATVKRGLNQVTLLVGDVDDSTSSTLSVTDVQLWVRYNE